MKTSMEPTEESTENKTSNLQLEQVSTINGIGKRMKDKWNNWHAYRVDVLSGWAYYTPTYAIQEAFCGKDLETIADTRSIGLIAHAIAMRPIGKVRNYFANKWGVTKESSIIDQIKVNVAAITPIQSVVYALMLGGGMAISGQYDVKSTLWSWGIGTGIGALHAIPYGYVQEWFRKKGNVPQAFK